jgi:hypothetical protein
MFGLKNDCVTLWCRAYAYAFSPLRVVCKVLMFGYFISIRIDGWTRCAHYRARQALN